MALSSGSLVFCVGHHIAVKLSSGSLHRSIQYARALALGTNDTMTHRRALRARLPQIDVAAYANGEASSIKNAANFCSFDPVYTSQQALPGLPRHPCLHLPLYHLPLPPNQVLHPSTLRVDIVTSTRTSSLRQILSGHPMLNLNDCDIISIYPDRHRSLYRTSSTSQNMTAQ